MLQKTPRLLAALSLTFAVFAGVGCGHTPTVRFSHAPTYSYMNDPEARAEVELWATIPNDRTPLASADLDGGNQ